MKEQKQKHIFDWTETVEVCVTFHREEASLLQEHPDHIHIGTLTPGSCPVQPQSAPLEQLGLSLPQGHLSGAGPGFEPTTLKLASLTLRPRLPFQLQLPMMLP